jgi:hypothetical protein
VGFLVFFLGFFGWVFWVGFLLLTLVQGRGHCHHHRPHTRQKGAHPHQEIHDRNVGQFKLTVFLRVFAALLELNSVQLCWWMRSSRVVRASDSQCRSRNCPGFDPSILRHSESEGRHMKQSYIKNKKIKKSPL